MSPCICRQPDGLCHPGYPLRLPGLRRHCVTHTHTASIQSVMRPDANERLAVWLVCGQYHCINWKSGLVWCVGRGCVHVMDEAHGPLCWPGYSPPPNLIVSLINPFACLPNLLNLSWRQKSKNAPNCKKAQGG